MRITVFIAAMLMTFSVSQAQNARTNSAVTNIGGQYDKEDSLRIMSEELRRVKAELASKNKELQAKEVWKRKKYWKFGVGYPSLESTDQNTMTGKPDLSIFLQRSRTAYLHSKPIGGMVKFGLDYGFMDLNYSNMKINETGTGGTDTKTGSDSDGFDEIVGGEPGLLNSSGMHKLEYALLAGPSISVNPWNHLIISAYYHLRPTASGILEGEKFAYGLGFSNSAGIAISYKAISFGAESLWGDIKYTRSSFNGNAENGSELLNKEGEFNLKQKGFRFYLAIRL